MKSENTATGNFLKDQNKWDNERKGQDKEEFVRAIPPKVSDDEIRQRQEEADRQWKMQ